MNDTVNHPAHYRGPYVHSACGEMIECIDIARHLDCDLGNVLKYIWRTGRKDDALEDLRKAQWYLSDRIAELERQAEAMTPECPRSADELHDPEELRARYPGRIHEIHCPGETPCWCGYNNPVLKAAPTTHVFPVRRW